MKNNILDFDNNIEPKLSPEYKFLGYLRFCWSLLIISRAIYLGLVWEQIMPNDNEMTDEMKIFIFLIFVTLVLLPVLYNLKQAKFEVNLDRKSFEKRKLRIFSIIIYSLLIIPPILSFNIDKYTTNLDLEIIFTMILLLSTLIILVVDVNYLLKK